MSIILETTVGDITIDLLTDERPRTCLNFLKLCKMKYYNYCLFHNVQRNFMAQTGDPTKTGKGGESIFLKMYGEQARYFEGEFKPRLKHKKIGTVSMANNGDNMYASQFFITTGEDLDYLDDEHVVFGEVAEGLDVLMKINESICDETHRPYKDIRVNHTVILDDPFDDPKGLEFPDRSPKPTKEQLESDRIGADEEIDDTKGKSLEELKEEIKDKEAKARAQILEMVGDLPTAEVKPPDNVLFVCKLNPVTTDEDLEIIFSRFGVIKSCEVIKDHKTQESLQYAFIEFEKPQDCENAYFKMDNVLIDDRRIHVDFSQSVAKLKLKWKKGGDFNKEETKEPNEKFLIKSKSSGDNKYDMVFDDGVLQSSSTDKKHKHKEMKKEKEKHRSRSRSRSKHRSRSRSRSKNRSPSPAAYRSTKRKDDKRERERKSDSEDDREYRKEKSRNYAKEREDRDTNRDWYRDRQRDSRDNHRKEYQSRYESNRR